MPTGMVIHNRIGIHDKPSKDQVIEDLIGHLLEIDGTPEDLPVGALAHEGFYLVKGQELGSDSYNSVGYHPFGRIHDVDEVVSGNPIDIIGGYMQDNQFHAYNSVSRPRHFKKSHWDQHRILKPLVEGTEYDFSIIYFGAPPPEKMRFVFENGILIPKMEGIKPRIAEKIDFLQQLKDPKIFKEETDRVASKYYERLEGGFMRLRRSEGGVTQSQHIENRVNYLFGISRV